MAFSLRVVFASTLAALGVLVACWGEARAQGKAQGKTVDPYTLDIASVRLGMSVKEAVAAIKQHFHASDEQISLYDRGRSIRPGKSLTSSVKYLENGATVLSVTFDDRIPFDDERPEYAVSIHYSYNSPVPGDSKQLRQAAYEKYGPPTFTDKSVSQEHWCAKILPRGFDGFEGCQAGSNPALVLSYEGWLELKDGSYWKKVQAAREEMNKPGKPKL